MVQPPTPTHEELLALDAEVGQHQLYQQHPQSQHHHHQLHQRQLFHESFAGGGEPENEDPHPGFKATPNLCKMLSSSRSQIKLVIFSSQGRLLHPQPVFGFVATSTIPLLAAPTRDTPTVRQDDCLVRTSLVRFPNVLIE